MSYFFRKRVQGTRSPVRTLFRGPGSKIGQFKSGWELVKYQFDKEDLQYIDISLMLDAKLPVQTVGTVFRCNGR